MLSGLHHVYDYDGQVRQSLLAAPKVTSPRMTSSEKNSRQTHRRKFVCRAVHSRSTGGHVAFHLSRTRGGEAARPAHTRATESAEDNQEGDPSLRETKGHCWPVSCTDGFHGRFQRAACISDRGFEIFSGLTATVTS